MANLRLNGVDDDGDEIAGQKASNYSGEPHFYAKHI